MVSALGIIAGVAAILAVLVTALLITVCLVAARITDAIGGLRGSSHRGTRGGGGMRAPMPPAAGRMPPAAGRMPPAAGNWRRNASGMPAAPRRGNR